MVERILGKNEASGSIPDIGSDEVLWGVLKNVSCFDIGGNILPLKAEYLLD